MPSPDIQTDAEFSAAERDAVYKCIFGRRDVRGQFLPDTIPDAVLARILKAAHHAPSVGFMQPWDFIVVRDAGVKRRVHDAFTVADGEAARMFGDERGRRAHGPGGFEVKSHGQSIDDDRNGGRIRKWAGHF